jgi:hypothetical protein
MNRIVPLAGLAMLASLTAPIEVQAKGCVRGAMAGAVVGHYAGHHAVAGAVGGCIVARAHYRHKAEEARRAPPQHH